MSTIAPHADLYVAVQPLAGLKHFETLRWGLLYGIRSRWSCEQLCNDAIGLIFAFTGISSRQFIVRPLGRGLEVRLDVTSVADFDKHGLDDVVEIPVPGVGSMFDPIHGLGCPTFSLLQDHRAGLLIQAGAWGKGFLLSRTASVLEAIAPIDEAEKLMHLTREAPEARFAMRLDFHVSATAAVAAAAHQILSQTLSADRVVRFDDVTPSGQRITTCWVKCAHTPVALPRCGYRPIPDVPAVLTRELCACADQGECEPAAKRQRTAL